VFTRDRSVTVHWPGAKRAVAPLAACVAVLAASAPAQAASGKVGGTTCAGIITFPVEITGNLTVPAGGICVLEGVVVDGNVSVAPGAEFLAFAAWMKRNLSTEGADTVNLIENEVDSNSSFVATSGGFSACGSGFISNCQFFNFNSGTPNPTPHRLANKFGKREHHQHVPGGGRLRRQLCRPRSELLRERLHHERGSHLWEPPYRTPFLSRNSANASGSEGTRQATEPALTG
jgi:hypothetical protein